MNGVRIEELFDLTKTQAADLLKEYTCYNALARVRTTNMGSLYEITFYVVLKNNVTEKEFIDALRCRNGNLNISLGLIPDKTEATL